MRKPQGCVVDVMCRKGRLLKFTPDRYFVRCSVHGDIGPLYAHYDLCLNEKARHILENHRSDKGDWK